MPSSVPSRRSSGARRRPSSRHAAIRRRRHRILAVVSAVTVVAGLAGLIGVRSLIGPSSSPKPASNPPIDPAPAQVVNAVTTMPLAQQLAAARTTPTVEPRLLHGPALTLGGKPELLYIGAEFCPYCAAERWAVVSALSHFGTWSGLQVTHSSSTDAYPNTPTLSFRSATYTSSYLSFRGVEETTNQLCQPGSGVCASNGYQLLQEPTAAEQRLIDIYDPHGSIPFIDLCGIADLVGASYDPAILAGQTPEQVAKCLGEPDTADAKQIGAAAATITKTLCQITKGLPARTCSEATA